MVDSLFLRGPHFDLSSADRLPAVHTQTQRTFLIIDALDYDLEVQNQMWENLWFKIETQ